MKRIDEPTAKSSFHLSWKGVIVTTEDYPFEGDSILLLHGLGCSRRDFAGASDPEGIAGYRLLSLDFPGHGSSGYPADETIDLGDLVDLTVEVLDEAGIDRVTVVGHSMGGVVGLLLARRHPDRIRGFVNVEGNLTPSDCDLVSRRAIELVPEYPGVNVLEKLADEVETDDETTAEYFRELPNRVREPAFVALARSLVRISDEEPLLDWFLGLDIPRAFVFGSSNRDRLPYLDRLESSDVEVIEITDSGHFPFHSNPRRFYEEVRRFLRSRLKIEN